MRDLSNAESKKLCGMCILKKPGTWLCTIKAFDPGRQPERLPCPALSGGCAQFSPWPRKPIPAKSLQPKLSRLAIPPGLVFLYIDRVTIAVLLRGEDLALGTIQIGFAFCHSGNAKKGIKPDRYSKIIGRNEAMKSLYDDPLIVRYLYDPIRIAKEVSRAVLAHNFDQLSRFGAELSLDFRRRVPGWTKAIAKRIDRGERLLRLYGRKGRSESLRRSKPGALDRIIGDVIRMPL